MPSVDDSIATKGIHPAAQPIHAWRKLLHQATAFTKQYTGHIWGTILEHANNFEDARALMMKNKIYPSTIFNLSRLLLVNYVHCCCLKPQYHPIAAVSPKHMCPHAQTLLVLSLVSHWKPFQQTHHSPIHVLVWELIVLAQAHHASNTHFVSVRPTSVRQQFGCIPTHFGCLSHLGNSHHFCWPNTRSSRDFWKFNHMTYISFQLFSWFAHPPHQFSW